MADLILIVDLILFIVVVASAVSLLRARGRERRSVCLKGWKNPENRIGSISCSVRRKNLPGVVKFRLAPKAPARTTKLGMGLQS